MKKMGPPDVDVPRRITSGEARLLGCPHTWALRRNRDGSITLLKPDKRMFWAVQFSDLNQKRLEQLLNAYWKADENNRGIYVRPDILVRIGNAASAALATGIFPQSVRSELEWVVATLGAR